ncbi:MAG TPA: MtrB/PioB family decaheme-associated outer membrane protein [Kiloniellales bacterium]|nr:MtrB/PioB family decaheme-associated outer membrane protein [Kiloniellales bacterium]
MLEEAPEPEEPKPVYTNSIEAGIGYNSEDSFKFGEYTGLEEEGPFAIGNVTVRGRAPYDSDSTEHWEIIGTDLGLDSRSVGLSYGRQGSYEAFLEFDQIPRFQIDDARTPFIGAGSQNLTLPPGWVADGNIENLTALRSSLRGVDIETRRDRYGGGLTWRPFDDWSVSASFRREEKDGLDTIGGGFGFGDSVILPEPIDYETDTIDFSVAYATRKLQMQFDYSFSNFRNEKPTLTFDNPFSTDPDEARGRFALPPDNYAHTFNLSGGYNWGDTNRIAANVSYSMLRQDETLLPYTVNNPGVNAPDPLPRDSAEAEIDNYLVNLNYSSRPLEDVDFRASYRYDRRDNNTPQDVFNRVRFDSGAQLVPPGSRARINLPLSFENHQAGADVGYRFMPRTKFTLGYQYDQKERDFQEVAITREHTVKGKLSATPYSWASGWVEYARSFREGSNYVDNRPFLVSHTEQFLAGEEDLFENHPQLRKFWFADRDRDAVRAVLTLMPHDQVTVGLSGNYTLDDYSDSLFGLQERTMAGGTLDVSYSPRPDLTGHVFFTYENFLNEQKGCESCTGTPDDTSVHWFVDNEDRIYTAGLGGEWNIIEDKLDFSFDYIFSLAFTDIDVTGGSALTVAPLPTIKSRLHALNARLDYNFRDNLTARLGYRFETLSTKDFAIDGIDVDTVEDVISLGESSPDYTAHVVGVSMIYRF